MSSCKKYILLFSLFISINFQQYQGGVWNKVVGFTNTVQYVFNSLVGFLTKETPFVYTPYDIMNDYDQWLFSYISNQKGVESNFANVYNEMQANSSSIKKLMDQIFKSLFNVLKEAFVKEKNYAEKKQKVYSLKIPKNLNTPIQKKINSVFDLDELLEKMKLPLIFSMEQKLQILVLIKEMQNNMKKIARDPKNIAKYTTQVFLSGPPGTGKTQLVYLLSEITGLPMVALSSSELILLGYESIRVLQEILDEVKESGAILFIDEAELFLMNREDLINLTEESAKVQNKGGSTEFSEVLHRLLTTFLAATGNQKHNIFISSNKIDIFDSAIRRRIKHFLYLNLPDNDVLGKIVTNYLKQNNISFADMTIDQAAKIIIDYNKKLKGNVVGKKNALIGFSGSDAKVMVNSLKEYLKPKVYKDVSYYIANKSDLIRVIEERLQIYALFGFNISMQSSGGLSLDLEEIETEFEKAEKIRKMKRLMQDLLDEARNHDIIIKLLFEKRVDGGFKMEITNKASLQDVNLHYNLCDKVFKGFKKSHEKTNKNIGEDVVFNDKNCENPDRFIQIIEKQKPKTATSQEKDMVFLKNNHLLAENYDHLSNGFNLKKQQQTVEDVEENDNEGIFMAPKVVNKEKQNDGIADMVYNVIYNDINKSIELHQEEFIG
jgi:SpoVK/Ycf46/Vps4 family AAA+-type ATPase